MAENQNNTMVQEAPLTDDLFERIGTEGLSGEDIGKQSLTYWADVWRRFRSDKMALLGLAAFRRTDDVGQGLSVY